MADDAVKAAYLKEVNSLTFRAKLGLHNLPTPFHNRTSISAVPEAVENGAFGRGALLRSGAAEHSGKRRL